MSNLIPTNIKLPAHVAARVGTQSKLAQSVMAGLGGGADYPRISIKGSRFRIVEGDNETVLKTTELDIIIVGANPGLSKAYFAQAWSADQEATGPDCYSMDGIKPAADAEDPQNDLCASCPQNAWGSKVTPAGQQIKACADKKRLAIVAADDPSGPIYLLEVTPAALKGLNKYQRELAMRGIPPEIVKTRLSFDTDASFPKLEFGFGGFIDEDDQEIVDGLFDTDEVKTITGEIYEVPVTEIASPKKAKPAPVVEEDDEEEEEAAPAPKRKPVAKEAKPAPVVEEEDDDEEEEEAPAPKRGFGAKAAPVVEEDDEDEAPAPKKAAPKKAAVAKSDGLDLADEIAALIDEVNDDE